VDCILSIDLISYSSLIIITTATAIPIKQSNHQIVDSLQNWQRERICLCSIVCLTNNDFDYLYQLRLYWVTV
jgi:hypothetical protein